MLKSAYYAAGSAFAGLQRARPFGRNIYSEDWDICIILDSARVDAYRAATGRECDAAWSVGSVTTEWLSNTFRPPYEDEIGETTLVTATPHSETVFGDGEWLTNADDVRIPYPSNPAVDYEAFRSVEEVWRTHATKENVVPPETMLDATLEAFERDGSRVVAHWMQPHEPFIAPDARLSGGDATETNVWRGLQDGDLETADVWQSYTANMDYAIESLETFLENVDANVLVTADHGNLFGWFGVYGHPFGMLHPAVRKVPWDVVEASDSGTYSPSSVLGTTSETSSVQDQLAALGYR